MKFKRILAVILAFCMVFSTMSFSVFAEEANVTVSTLEQLQEALEAESDVPIVITDTIVIPAGENVTIDLNGKKISNTIDDEKEMTWGMLSISATSTLTIQDTNGGTGTITGMLLNYGTLNVVSGNITNDSDTVFATIVCQPDDHGNIPMFNVTGGTISYTGNSEYGMAIYAFNTNNRISDLTFSDGANVVGDITVEANTKISGGTFDGTITVSNGEVVVTGGTFTEGIDESYLADGFELNKDGNVVESAPAEAIVATVNGLNTAIFSKQSWQLHLQVRLNSLTT